MMKQLQFLLVSMSGTLLFSQDSGGTIDDVKYKYEKAFKQINGVIGVGIGGVNGEHHLVVTVRSPKAKEAVERFSEKGLEGYKVYIILSEDSPLERNTDVGVHDFSAEDSYPWGKPSQTRVAPPSTNKRSAGQTMAEPVHSGDPYHYCDVVRRYLKLPPLPGEPKCREMEGCSNDPVRIEWVLKNRFPHEESLVIWGQQISSKSPSSTHPLKGLLGRFGSGAKFFDERYFYRCLEHKVHRRGRALTYAWIKHRLMCPLGEDLFKRLIDKRTPK